MGVTVKKMIITPEKAEQMLECNTHNRVKRKRHVTNLAGIMTRGEFLFNGETIKFDENGVLQDGQHRLLACIESGVTIESLVVRGLSATVFHTIDRGSKRIDADVLYRAGYSNTKTLAAVLKLVYNDGITNGFRNRVAHRVGLSSDMILELAKAHPKLAKSVEATYFTRLIMPQSIAAFCHYQFFEKDPDLATWFFDKLTTGENINRKHPVHLLRNYLLQAKGAVHKHKSENEIKLAFCRKTWNAHRNGTKLKTLVLKKNEAFPEVV